MKMFNAGAWRPANGDARAAQLSAANDLVQRTLAQNGITIPSGQGANTPMQGGMPSMETLLAGLGKPLNGAATQTVPIPDGAEFRKGQFSCAAGSRAYRTYVPSTAAQGASGVVVMLHGCTQTPEDFAAGTDMNALAEERGFVVVYPQQSRGDNAQSCWNWFSRGDQRRDRGEPAILAGMTREVMTEFNVAPDRTFVAGLSAGAAMAVILGETYPDIFAAIGVHSGLPFAAAKDVPSAFAAMAGNALQSPGAPRQGASVPVIVFHGSADATVHPSNGDRIVQDTLDRVTEQTLVFEDRDTASGRTSTRRVVSGADGTTLLEYWKIDGLGHAWSGGKPAGSYTDAKGPDASAQMIRFFFETPAKEL